MEALKNLCKTQNICLICTLHQSSSELLSMTDYTYVLAKGGHNVFWGPTIELKGFLNVYGILTSDANRVPIETLVRLSAEGLRDIRLVNMNSFNTQVISNRINLIKNLLVHQNFPNKNKKFCYKDVFIQIQREYTDIYRYRYKFYLTDIFITIMTTILLANTFGTDIGQYDDCLGLEANIGCQQRKQNMNNVERNANYMGIMLWIMSLMRVSLTIHDKLIKTKYFYHDRQNS